MEDSKVPLCVLFDILLQLIVHFDSQIWLGSFDNDEERWTKRAKWNENRFTIDLLLHAVQQIFGIVEKEDPADALIITANVHFSFLL